MPQVRLIKDRLLYFYSLLSEGKVIYKEEEAEHFNCSTRSIQRDIEDIRAFLHDQSEKTGYVQDLVFDRSVKGYRLQPAIRQVLSNEEVFAVLKILLESRAFTKEELNPILDKLIECCVPKENKRMVSDLIANEKYHYVEPRHKTNYLVPMWQLSTAVREHKLVRMEYIKSFEILPEHFHVPYQNRFEEGEFRKRVQFMYGGKLQKIKFWFHGDSVEAVLDRLPTARIIEQGEKGYLISADLPLVMTFNVVFMV